MKEYQSLSHTTWDRKYHVVLIPKSRKQRIFGNNGVGYIYLSINVAYTNLAIIKGPDTCRENGI